MSHSYENYILVGGRPLRHKRGQSCVRSIASSANKTKTSFTLLPVGVAVVLEVLLVGVAAATSESPGRE